MRKLARAASGALRRLALLSAARASDRPQLVRRRCLSSRRTTVKRRQLDWMPARTPRGDAVLVSRPYRQSQDLRRALPDQRRGRAAMPRSMLPASRVRRRLRSEDRRAICDDRLVAGRSIGEARTQSYSGAAASCLAGQGPADRGLGIARDYLRLARCAAKSTSRKSPTRLFLNYREEERGWYKGVARVPLGSQCHIDAKRETTTRYYDLAGLPRRPAQARRGICRRRRRTVRRGDTRRVAGFREAGDQPEWRLSISQAVAAYASRVIGPDAPPIGPDRRSRSGVGWA